MFIEKNPSILWYSKTKRQLENMLSNHPQIATICFCTLDHPVEHFIDFAYLLCLQLRSLGLFVPLFQFWKAVSSEWCLSSYTLLETLHTVWDRPAGFARWLIDGMHVPRFAWLFGKSWRISPERPWALDWVAEMLSRLWGFAPLTFWFVGCSFQQIHWLDQLLQFASTPKSALTAPGVLLPCHFCGRSWTRTPSACRICLGSTLMREQN